MIEKLDNNDLEVAETIRNIFQLSYAVEAELLQAIDFPPLHRPLLDFIGSNNEFYAYISDNSPVAIIEINPTHEVVHIQSLVVLPAHFHQGIASRLLQFVLKKFGNRHFTVETGEKNRPAKRLYKKLGFMEIEQWDTDHGVRKVRFKRKIK